LGEWILPTEAVNFPPHPVIIIIVIIITTTTTTTIISTHLEEQSLLPAEQKGCHPGSKGCKDQLMISKMRTAGEETRT